ncbi:HAD-IA family hydrolase [Corynebacterium cystitidis]|nr:HAD-IA family hydrolase [Corynebacterium cystitidis]
MKKLAVFDMAGTTIDDRDEVYRVLREATERFGARYTDEQFQHFMGTEKKYAIHKLFEIGGVDVTDELVDEAWQWFREELRRTYTKVAPTPLPGVEDALRALRSRGVKVALTTGFSREIADIILTAMGWDESLLDATCTGDEVEVGRPEPFMIQEVMKKLGITDTAEVISVGDTAADVESAQRAGVTSVGVLTGHVTAEQFTEYGADLVLSSASDLPAHEVMA